MHMIYNIWPIYCYIIALLSSSDRESGALALDARSRASTRFMSSPLSSSSLLAGQMA